MMDVETVSLQWHVVNPYYRSHSSFVTEGDARAWADASNFELYGHPYYRVVQK